MKGADRTKTIDGGQSTLCKVRDCHPIVLSRIVTVGFSWGMLQMVRAAMALVLLLLVPSGALAQKRVALVIGNSAYQHTPKLINPKNDATDMAAALKKHGFQVLEGYDLDKAVFDRKIRDFATALSTAQVGVFFFAGHGLQVSGHNYLVPIDAQLSTASALEFEMVRLDLVHRIMERETQTNILFLDACRDNPLARNLARAMGTRSAEIGRGLAQVESGVGTLISYSTQPGNVALDGTGRNSPFAGALVKHITSSSDSLSDILISVRNDVRKDTNNKQVPWEHSALTGRFHFSNTPASSQPPPAPARLSEAAEAWGTIKDTTNIAILETFIARYKDTFFADLARSRLDDLKKQLATAVPAAPKPVIPIRTFFKGQTTRQSLVTNGPLIGATVRDSSAAQLGTVEFLILEEGATVGLLFKHRGKFVALSTSSPNVSSDPASSSVTLHLADATAVLAALDSYQRSETPVPVGCAGVEAIIGNEKRCLKPKDTFKDCPDCPEMVVVPAGEFMMGSNEGNPDERPVHKVTIGKPFAVAKFETTFAEWNACVVDGGCSQKGDAGGGGIHPVISVSWYDAANQYIPWLSRKTQKTYRLLTEAEWEYAARAGTTTTYSWGNGLGSNNANCDRCGVRWNGSAPVGSFPANAFGLHDMLGNAWEWVEDCYHKTYQNAPTNGSASANVGCERSSDGKSHLRVLRGGSWNGIPWDLRVARRASLQEDNRSVPIGFRVARTLSP